jgi:hypothetical protein
MAICNILRPLGMVILFGHFKVTWYDFLHFGKLNLKKSGNPGERARLRTFAQFYKYNF